MKYLTINDIGCKVKTPYGIGVLVDVDAGAAFIVEPLNDNEEWEDCKFDRRQLERMDTEIASLRNGENYVVEI